MAEKILIGSRLPNSLTIAHPQNKESKVTILGVKHSKTIGATYMTTLVDAEFWATWRAAYMSYVPLKSGAIFEAKSVDHAEGKAKEMAKEKTGFEKMKPDAMGVKPADK